MMLTVLMGVNNMTVFSNHGVQIKISMKSSDIIANGAHYYFDLPFFLY